MGRKCPWKDFLNIILAWNIQNWPLQMGSGEVASAFVFKLMCPFTSQKCLLQELPLFFSRSALMFPGIVFLFSISALLFSRSVFVFLKKCFILFQNRSLVFQKSVLYIYCECLFPRMVFFNWLCLLLVLLRAAQIDDICLAVVLFPLGSLYWPTYDAFLTTLTPLHGVWFFVYFI